jgi:hypothetical protein
MEYTVEYLIEQDPQQTDSAFYCWTNGWEVLAVVKSGDREFHIGSNGEMRINLPNGDVLRYTSDLLSAGIDTDIKLSEFMEKHDWIHNNWFEIYEKDSVGEWWEVCETLEEGIEAARHALEMDLTNVIEV